MDHFDEDWNVRDMRAVAKSIGLTALLVRAIKSTNAGQIKELLREALKLLGEQA